jgi:hypothetical protein
MIRKPYQQENPQKKKRTQVDDMNPSQNNPNFYWLFFFLEKKNLC